jgi:hypothetical protein
MSICLRLLAAALTIAALEQSALARGFGGARSAGFSGGMRAGGYGGYRSPSVAAYRPYNRGYAGVPGGYRAAGYNRYAGAGYRDVSRGDLNRYLDLPTDAGLSAVTGGAGRQVAASTAAAGAAARGSRYMSPAWSRAQGAAVRRDFNGYGWYSGGWYGRYPGAWRPAAWYRANLAAGAWAYASWPWLDSWFGYGGTAPLDYAYGDNLVYDAGYVYYQDQPVGTAANYYDQVSVLAGSGPEPQADSTDWLPLGVFSLAEENQTQPSLVFQLAVNKEGTIRGNCSQPDQEFVGVITGAVDKQKQLAAWTVGHDRETVYETGLYNLTKDESTALVHRGPDDTEQWLLVRMHSPEQPPASAVGAND